MIIPTQGNERVIVTKDPVAPMINPVGELPPAGVVSAGDAAGLASSSATENKNILGLLGEGAGARNVLFLAVVGIVIYKFRGRIF